MRAVHFPAVAVGAVQITVEINGGLVFSDWDPYLRFTTKPMKVAELLTFLRALLAE
jgi:hypothetical protein